MSAGGESTRVILIALVANLGIATAKFIGAMISGSAALLAEAIHSLVDTTNQGLLLVGNKRSKRAPTEQHPLGYGREAFFWSFIVAILLFSLGGLFAIYEGVHKISDHEPISSPLLGLTILLVSIGLEGYSFWACYKEVKTQNKYSSLWEWLRKTTSCELLVIFTEDAAALLGLLIATVSLLLAWVTGNPIMDALGSIAVGTVLVVVAIFLAIEIRSLIIGEAPPTDFKNYLDGLLARKIPGAKLLRLIALQIGAAEVMVSYKISTGEIKEVDQLHRVLNEIEKAMKEQFPEIKWQFIEPDVTDG